MAATTVFDTVESKRPNTLRWKLQGIDAKHSSAFDCNKFTGEILNKKIKGKGLVNICHVFVLTNAFDLDKNIETLSTNEELKLVT